jgi:hypothetical protein
MASRVFEIGSYLVTWRLSWSYPRPEVALNSVDGQTVCQVFFMTDDSQLPTAQIWTAAQGANVYLWRRDMPTLVDLLRNEQPIWLSIDEDGTVAMGTKREPIGESER